MKLPIVFPISSTTNSVTGVNQEQPKIRLHYLDGLRGLAALLVFLYHIAREMNWRLQEGELHPLLLKAGHFLPYGRIAVAVFIVLSGYCLMLPVIKSGQNYLVGGWFNYLKRRAKRILPPYYAALLLSLLLFALVPTHLGPGMGLHWNEAQPAFTPGVLISHGLMLHNLKYDWTYKINGVMWTIATEWQIYFFFPLLLLPLWRRFGLIAVVIGAFGVGLIPHYLLNRYLDWAFPWYLGLFALGMAGAVIGFSQQRSLLSWRDKLPWGLVCIGCLAVFATQKTYWHNLHAWTIDALIGAVTTCLLIYCTRHITHAQTTQRPLILKLLESRLAIGLGSFSYSFYLIHAPILGLSWLLVNNLPISSQLQLLVFPIVTTPLSLLSSYGFHLVFEQRFMNHPLGRR